MRLITAILAVTLSVCVLMFLFSLPFYLGRCLLAAFGATIAFFERRGFWHTLAVLWPRVRF